MAESPQALTAPPEAGGHSRFLGQLRDRIAASDPAFSRLRLTGRAMLSLLLNAVLLAAFHLLVHPLPIASYGLAVVVSFIGAMAVRDPTPGKQAVTRSYAAAVSIVAVLAASLLAPWPLAAYAVFLAVIFAAVYIRRFGMRWFGIGMIGFMAYFMGDYLRPQFADMGWVAFAAVLAFAVTHLVTTVLLRDDPEQDFRRALVTIDRRINLILRDLRSVAVVGRGSAADDRSMQGHLSALREIVLMAQGFLPQGEEGSLAAEGAASDVAVALFELQLAIERAVGASYLAPPPAALIDAVLSHDDAAVERWAREPGQVAGEKGVAAQLLVRVHRARARLAGELGPTPSPAFAEAPQVAIPRPPGAGGGASETSSGLIPKALRLPIQVTLASGIALGCGLMLSPVRWYWAVITAFIVFNNTRSRADTAVRAMQRSAGTFAGLIAGTVVATLLAGQMVVSMIGIVLLFAIGFYFLQVSYSVMIFCVTVALALLYGVMGMFTPQLLLLRLEETVAGTGVAFFLFPSRASTGVSAMLDEYLDAMDALIAGARKRVHGEADGGNLLALSRGLDRSYSALASAVRPMGGPWTAVTRFGYVREKLLLLTGCAHWGRRLARSLEGLSPSSTTDIARFDLAAEESVERVSAVRARGAAIFTRPPHPGGGGSPETRRAPLRIAEREDPVFALEVISQLLGRLMN